MFSLCVVARAGAPSTQPVHLATEIVLHDLKDQAVTPLALSPGHRAVVLVFISTDCPISNTYAPTIGDLCRTFADKRIEFFTVYEDSPLTTAAAKEHHDAYGYPCDALLDSQQNLAHLCGAHVTPEAVAVGPAGTVLYRGRIDDLFTSVGRKRYVATTHELKDLLDEVAADATVNVPWMPAVGCEIP